MSVDIELRSFGFKYGTPRSNNVLDVSFLPNPARLFGLDSDVDDRHREFVLSQPAAKTLLSLAESLACFLISQRDRPVLAFGCSSGRHRSVVMVEELASRLRQQGFSVSVIHEECHA